MLKVINLFKHSEIKDHLLVHLTRSKFNMSLTKHIPEKIVGLFNYRDNRCMLHNNGYINSCKEFTFNLNMAFSLGNTIVVSIAIVLMLFTC